MGDPFTPELRKVVSFSTEEEKRDINRNQTFIKKEIIAQLPRHGRSIR
jgi:hypothetical protein